MISKILLLEHKHQTIFIVVLAFAVIQFWRGVWGITDELLVPSVPWLSFLLSGIIGLVILLVTHQITKRLQ